MKILIVTQRNCIRTLKQLIALSHTNEVHLITKRLPSGKWCKTVTYYNGDESSLREALKLYDFVDIVYVHSEPSWIVFNVREVLSDKKVILDIHDAQVWRSADPRYRSAEERLAFKWADALVVPSNACKRVLAPSLPCVVLPPYCNEFVYQARSWGWRGGIVYEGRVDLPAEEKFMDYAKYDLLAKELDKRKIAFHIYLPAKSDKDIEPWRKIYEKICFFHKGLLYEQMLSVLGFYDWGLCGNIKSYRNWNLAMPNKVFDYMAGGIPIIALNAKEAGKFVEKHGIGISVKSLDEIEKRWNERQECQKNVFLKRHNFTMEKHIHVVEDLMRSLL